eukprot:8048788-Alexandrium_andersonii.AAC.1
MSASLVGSEMCIRDSGCAHRPVDHARLAWLDIVRWTPGSTPCFPFRVEPVSYTHLTLPTICSV